MIGVLSTLAYSASCLAAGLLAMRALALPLAPSLQMRLPVVSSALILGQALVSSLWLLLGLAGWLLPWVVWSVIVVCIFAAFTFWKPVFLNGAERIRGLISWWCDESATIRLLSLGLFLLATAFCFAAWLKPPFGDAEAFYMTYARIIAATGRIEPMPGLYETFSSIGMVGEPHFAALIAVASVPAAKLFVWPVAIASAAMLHAIGQTAGLSNRGNLLLLAMLFTTTAFTHHIWDGKVDLFAAALGLVAVYWVLAARNTILSRSSLAIAGLAAGFSVVAKFSYAVSLGPALLVLLVLAQDKSASVANRVVPIGRVGLWATMAAIPHLIKNTVLFAAPLAPFLGGGAEQNWLQQVWFAPEVVSRIVASYPLALTFGRYPMQGGNLSFLWLAFLPLVWWLPRPAQLRSNVLFQLCLAGFAGTLAWVILRPSIIAPRYLLTVLLLFYPLSARAAEYILDWESSTRWVSHTIACVTFAAFAIFTYPLLPIAVEGARQVMGHDTGPCTLASVHCPALLRLNADAKPGDRVYALSYYTYWMRDDLLQCRDRGAESKAIHSLGGTGLTWEALLDGGFNWLVVDKTSHGREYLALIGGLRPNYLDVETSDYGGDLLILRLTDQRSGRSRPCHLAGSNSWVLVTEP